MIDLIICDQSFADVIKQIEEQGQILYQVRNRLTDNEGNNWQIILFKRLKEGKTTEVDLRLVGFPDAVKFNHPQDLTLSTVKGEQIKAHDQFAEKAPADNVGQYDLQKILSRSIDEKSITLLLPVKEKSLALKIPYPILLEWQEIANP
ncbi:DUF3122 domain-containing protein [Geminocystis sp. NIES-3709]|uniref:DUF3122 domain-containing protein n=1 Tax=Geminocystis sp. NIES-3709 TaxID=1617448 RepID=UPI0005FC7D87|nr:DUF3122 domain-containing protein [Geminocystis sp. NIES-3709]BAQ65319.1 hypothetical protein GM3709_2084 [Geminocystis sp. NIES-3709]